MLVCDVRLFHVAVPFPCRQASIQARVQESEAAIHNVPEPAMSVAKERGRERVSLGNL